MTPDGAPRDADDGAAVRLRLDGLLRGSRRAMLWEQAWPALWWPIAVVLAFLVVSWIGLWLDLPPLARQVGTGLFGLALLGSFVPLLRLRPPGRTAALDRLDRGAGPGAHRPARAALDTLAVGERDAGTRALWALHLRRAAGAVGRLSVSPPRPGMVRRDPFAVRGIAIAATVAAAAVAGPDAGARLRSAFDWRGAGPLGAPFRIDGWVDPPLYTRLPPLMIDLASGRQTLKAPVGSTVVIRFAGSADATISPGPGLRPVPKPDGTAAPAGSLREERYLLAAPTDLAVRAGLTGGGTLHLDAVPDRPPTVGLVETPTGDERGNLTVAYWAKDDYGLAEVAGVLEKTGPGADRRTLLPAPRLPLGLPADPASGEKTAATTDVSESPWAGARVRMTLVARDEAKQEGASAPVEITLPARAFANPLARALVEQRRILVLDPDRPEPVQRALDALLIAPDRFTPQWGVFLGLKAAAGRLRAARTDAELTDVADWLWAMALQLEDGGLSDAEAQLRAAQERLNEAIDRGADETEIRRLTDELRTAMDRYLREFAERADKDRSDTAERQTGPERTITQNDLNRMLDRMQDAMRRGDTAEAQRLLDQLKDILNGLKTARPGNRTSDPLAREMNRQMDELDRLTREQQDLRDETFRDGQERRGRRGGQQQGRQRPGSQQPGAGQRGPRGSGQQPGDDGEDGQEGAENGGGAGGGSPQDLARRQQALRDRLGQLQRRMRGLGMKGEQGLADADGAMGDAGEQLGQGQGGSAVDSQGRALDGLRRGMQGMAQQMQGMMGQGDGQEDGDPNGPGTPQGRAENDPRSDDPLGRPTRSRDFSDGRVRIPGADEGGVERARRILDELRRKLGDPSRAPAELDYFERLLKPN